MSSEVFLVPANIAPLKYLAALKVVEWRIRDDEADKRVVLEQIKEEMGEKRKKKFSVLYVDAKINTETTVPGYIISRTVKRIKTEVKGAGIPSEVLSDANI